MTLSRTLLAFLALAAMLAGCRGAPAGSEPIVPIRNMYNQPRYDAQGTSHWFSDGRTMRPQVPGTLAREMEVDPIVATGWSEEDQTWILTIPPSIVQELGDMERVLARGRERYDIYCSPCHGYSGAGDGIVGKRGGGPITPPTFHSERIQHMPDGQMYATITNGVRNMPPYSQSVPLADRWAIVSYVRALQLSQAQAAQAMNDSTIRREPTP